MVVVGSWGTGAGTGAAWTAKTTARRERTTDENCIIAGGREEWRGEERRRMERGGAGGDGSFHLEPGIYSRKPLMLRQLSRCHNPCLVASGTLSSHTPGIRPCPAPQFSYKEQHTRANSALLPLAQSRSPARTTVIPSLYTHVVILRWLLH